jgi:CheY-like chemotaxis protein
MWSAAKLRIVPRPLRELGNRGPDLIIMDLVVPRMNGIEASSVIRNTMPDVPIIAFTMYDTLAQSLKSSLA